MRKSRETETADGRRDQRTEEVRCETNQRSLQLVLSLLYCNTIGNTSTTTS